MKSKLAALGAILCVIGNLRAADDGMPPVEFPHLIKQAMTPEAFVPEGWTLESKTIGDLNSDGIPDVVLLLRDTDKRNFVGERHVGVLGSNDTNPYLIAVIGGSPAGPYNLVLEDHTLIPRPPKFSMYWPSIEIKRGTLRVMLDEDQGGLGEVMATFTFRRHEDIWSLIGYDYLGTAHGGTLSMGVNFLTGRVEASRGHITSPNDPERAKLRTARFVPEALVALQNVGNGLKYRPKQLCLLEKFLCP